MAAHSTSEQTAAAPSTVVFTASPDHDTGVVAYLLDVFASGSDPSTATPTASLSLGKPAPDANGEITVERAAFFGSLAPGSYVLTVASVGADATTRSTPVSFTVGGTAASTAQAPFGAFDTPENGITGVTGEIPVTGWALDDAGISRIRIVRDPVGDEDPNTPVYIGDAVRVDGARPDVANLYPAYPDSRLAGWGYLLLTNSLPDRGNGTFVLTALADDIDGHTTRLGTRTITCSNRTATTPFGTIDTPAQGGVASGTLVNFGWVLSSGPRRADPPAGGMVRIVVDGEIVPATLSQWTRRADLAALYPESEFPGVANALGVATLDTTTMPDGVHTIAWLVTDSAGSTKALGSRFFTTVNGNGAAGLRTTSAQRSSAAANAEQFSAMRTPPAAQDVTPVAGLAAAPIDSAPISGRRGYDLDAPLQQYPAQQGLVTVQSEELDRVELHLGARGYSAYLRTGNRLAPLPIGASLDETTGIFTWVPPAGFVGGYDLVFVRRSGQRAVGRKDVRLVLNPKASNRVGPQITVDSPTPEAADVSHSFVVAGWTADLDSATDSGMDAVDVWAYPVETDGSHRSPQFVGEAAYGIARSDVAAVYGKRFLNSGYQLVVKDLAPGTYDIVVFAFSKLVGDYVPGNAVRVTVR